MTTLNPMSTEYILNYRKQSSKNYIICQRHPKALYTGSGIATFLISNKENEIQRRKKGTSIQKPRLTRQTASTGFSWCDKNILKY